MKDNSIHMPCIIAPKTFSYIHNAEAQLRASQIEANAQHSQNPQIARLLQRSLGDFVRWPRLLFPLLRQNGVDGNVFEAVPL